MKKVIDEIKEEWEIKKREDKRDVVMRCELSKAMQEPNRNQIGIGVRFQL